MTALSQALEAAQARAVAALAKQYVAGRVDSEQGRETLAAIGLRDLVEQDSWFAALDVLRDTGASAPGEQKATAQGEPDKATDAQLALIKSLVEQKAVPAPDYPETLTRAKASELIAALQKGTYNADDWQVPF